VSFRSGSAEPEGGTAGGASERDGCAGPVRRTLSRRRRAVTSIACRGRGVPRPRRQSDQWRLPRCGRCAVPVGSPGRPTWAKVRTAVPRPFGQWWPCGRAGQRPVRGPGAAAGLADGQRLPCARRPGDGVLGRGSRRGRPGVSATSTSPRRGDHPGPLLVVCLG